ncbi:hypothetical protein GLOIN_2v1474454 [Rhizophagus clarus]|uniref:HTH myb-type domain-containing protein n=1 Tax=Rhizophagus clarus TaxID=94130 RepID=A0A8H3LCZ6_9GLOM|nr:hypothetical protein GLOIN_2v1474454 [Rhizophagus clarus]
MLFDNVSNQIILDCVYFLEKCNVRNKYERISKILPQYTSRQIRHHYRNVLNVRRDNEKDFIVQWIEQHQEPNGTIRWKDLIPEMESRFGKLYSENKLKNFWYRRKLRLERDAGSTVSRTGSSSSNPISGTNNQNMISYNLYSHFLPLPLPKFQPIFRFKHPYRMNPLF